MTVDRELTPGHGTFAAGGGSPPRQPEPVGPPEPVSRATIIWYSAVAAILFSWFLFGWLVLEQGFIDSVGEALGTGFALLLAISVVGTVRRSRSRHAVGVGSRPGRRDG